MIDRVLRGIFYGETLLNVVAAVFPFTAPAAFLAQFTDEPTPPVTLQIVRWYGVLLFVFVAMEGQALLSKRDDLLAMLLRAFLFGDLIQLAILPAFREAGGKGDFAYQFTLWVTVLLVIARITWLVRYHRRDPVDG